MDTDVLVGSIQLFPYSFAPRGWMSCEGQILSIMDYQMLYSLIGATYGGDGRSTFGIPNLKGAEPLSTMKYYIALNGIYPSRNN